MLFPELFLRSTAWEAGACAVQAWAPVQSEAAGRGRSAPDDDRRRIWFWMAAWLRLCCWELQDTALVRVSSRFGDRCERLSAPLMEHRALAAF